MTNLRRLNEVAENTPEQTTSTLTEEIVQIKSVRYFPYSIRFWQFFAIMVVGNYFYACFAFSYKVFGENDHPHEQIDDKLLTWAASIGSGGINGLSRLIFGSLVDKYSFR